jgi:hypothetical protein
MWDERVHRFNSHSCFAARDCWFCVAFSCNESLMKLKGIMQEDHSGKNQAAECILFLYKVKNFGCKLLRIF